MQGIPNFHRAGLIGEQQEQKLGMGQDEEPEGPI